MVWLGSVGAWGEARGVFGGLVAVVLLKEPLRPARIVAALMIVGGLMLLRIA